MALCGEGMGMTKFFIDRDGNYLGGYDGAEPPEGAIEVAEAPHDARQKWTGGRWQPFVEVPDRVSSRQFKMQLQIVGLKQQVDGWVASQGALVQIAYENSGSFVRTEPMMLAGLAALGFTDQQIDGFFIAASTL